MTINKRIDLYIWVHFKYNTTFQFIALIRARATHYSKSTVVIKLVFNMFILAGRADKSTDAIYNTVTIYSTIKQICNREFCNRPFNILFQIVTCWQCTVIRFETGNTKNAVAFSSK